jgi:hypothetical protein
MAKKATKKGSSANLKNLTAQCRTEVKALVDKERAVQVVGRVRNGVLEIDQSSLDEFTRKFPNANATFIAVNAPFDPHRSTTL